MARSHRLHRRRWFPPAFERSLAAELEAPSDRLTFKSPGAWRGPGIGQSPVSRSALVAALARRGWRPAKAQTALDHGGWSEDAPDATDRRLAWRAYRRQAKVLTDLGRADEIGPYAHMCGCGW